MYTNYIVLHVCDVIFAFYFSVTDDASWNVEIYFTLKTTSPVYYSHRNKRDLDEASLIFEDQHSLYLAKNILPAISLLTLEKTSPQSDSKISLKPNKKEFANLISHGIMNDYADVEFEN